MHIYNVLHYHTIIEHTRQRKQRHMNNTRDKWRYEMTSRTAASTRYRQTAPQSRVIHDLRSLGSPAGGIEFVTACGSVSVGTRWTIQA